MMEGAGIEARSGGLYTMRQGSRIVFPDRPGVTVWAGHRFAIACHGL
jgi:hypothetical protein